MDIRVLEFQARKPLAGWAPGAAITPSDYAKLLVVDDGLQSLADKLGLLHSELGLLISEGKTAPAILSSVLTSLIEIAEAAARVSGACSETTTGSLQTISAACCRSGK